MNLIWKKINIKWSNLRLIKIVYLKKGANDLRRSTTDKERVLEYFLAISEFHGDTTSSLLRIYILQGTSGQDSHH
jgi:hypothetical protein